MMFAPILLGGAASLPIPGVWDGMMAVIKKLMGSDDPEEWIYDNLEKQLGPIGNIARHGIPGMGGYGIDLSGSFSMTRDIPTKLTDMLGVTGSLVSDVYYGGKDILAGNVYKGTERIVPRFAGQAMKGYREYKEGVTTKRNKPVFYGKEVLKPNMTEAIMEFLSFNPSRLSKTKAEIYSGKKVTQNYKEMRDGINDSIKQFYLQPREERSKDKWMDILADIYAYNMRVTNKGLRGIEPFITSESIRNIINRNFKPTRKELMQYRRNQ